MSMPFKGRARRFSIDVPIFVASASLNTLALLTPLVILMVFDRVIPFQSTETLSLLALALLCAAAMEFVMRWARSVLLGSAAEQAALDNHNEFMDRTLRAQPRAHSGTSAAVHLERYSAIGRLRDHFSGQNQALAIDLPFTFVFIGMVGLIGGGLVVVPLASLAAILVFATFMIRAQRRIFDERKHLDARRFSFLAEAFRSILTIKANTMQRQMSRRFEMLSDQNIDASHRQIIFAGFAQNFGAVFAQLSVAAMGLCGAYLVIQGAIGIAELAACMLLNGRITQPLLRLMSFWVQSESVSSSLSKLRDVTELPVLQARSGLRAEMRGQLIFDKVELKERETDTVLARDISFALSPGEICLIKAEDQRVFAAISAALSAEQRETSGRILIDGCLAPDRVHQRGALGLATLEPEPAIFSATLLDNLCAFGTPEQVKRAKFLAEQVGLEKRIHRLPLGYDTPMTVGSAFEKDPANRQLIALIRVLALEPRILVLDAPTSVLENAERDALARLLSTLAPRPTLLISSPDPRFERIADRVVEIAAPQTTEMEAWVTDAALDMTRLSLPKEVAA